MSLKVGVVKKDGGIFVLSSAGSIDTGTYLVLEKEIKSALASSAKVIVFDMKGVDYISSMGWNLLFQAKEEIEKEKGTIAIVNLNPRIEKVFDIIKILPQYYFSTMQEAENYLDKFIGKDKTT